MLCRKRCCFIFLPPSRIYWYFWVFLQHNNTVIHNNDGVFDFSQFFLTAYFSQRRFLFHKFQISYLYFHVILPLLQFNFFHTSFALFIYTHMYECTYERNNIHILVCNRNYFNYFQNIAYKWQFVLSVIRNYCRFQYEKIHWYLRETITKIFAKFTSVCNN